MPAALQRGLCYKPLHSAKATVNENARKQVGSAPRKLHSDTELRVPCVFLLVQNGFLLLFSHDLETEKSFSASKSEQVVTQISASGAKTEGGKYTGCTLTQ